MKFELLPGEEICPDCKGNGEQPGTIVEGFRINCRKCWGDGKLDWIEMAMGKQMKDASFMNVDPEGSCDLYYAGRKILETTPRGIRVT